MRMTRFSIFKFAALAAGILGFVLWFGGGLVWVVWSYASPPTDLAELAYRQGIFSKIGIAGFVLIQLANSLAVIISPPPGRAIRYAGLAVLWIGMAGLFGLLPGLWAWYLLPMILGSIVANDLIPGLARRMERLRA